MSDFQYILPALAQVFTVTNLALIFGGLILGMIVGCIPGLSVTLGTVSYTHLKRKSKAEKPEKKIWLSAFFVSWEITSRETKTYSCV